MDWSSLTARGSMPAGVFSAPISKRSSTRESGFAEVLADLGMGEEWLVPFLAEVIGTPPRGKRACRAEARRLQRAETCSRWALAQREWGKDPCERILRKMSARRHLKYYLKGCGKILFSISWNDRWTSRSKLGSPWRGSHRKSESFALALQMSARRH